MDQNEIKINLKTYTYLSTIVCGDFVVAPLSFMAVCGLPKWHVSHRIIIIKNPAKWVAYDSSKISVVEDLHNVSA